MLRPAPEVQAIAWDLMKTVPVHAPLAAVRIEYVFMQKNPVKNNRIVLGRVRKVGGLAAYFADDSFLEADRFLPAVPFFVMEIAEPTWLELDDKKRRALVDHELCHCVVDDEVVDAPPKLSTRGHDLEEFIGIVNRHGLWSAGLELFTGAVAKQLTLAIDELEGFANGDGD